MGGTFVEIILQNLMALFPFVIVRTYQRGVRWTLGKNPTRLNPGFHWKVWLLHQVEIVSVVDEVVNLPVQSVMTKDRKLICFSVNIGFRIDDPVKHWEGVQDFEESTRGLSMTHLAKRVREKSLDELLADLPALESSLRATLTTRFKDWGTEVFSVGFTDFAETQHQIRLFTEQQILPGRA